MAFVLFVTLFIRNSNSVLVYDRATLLNIRSIYEKQFYETREEFQFGVRNPPISIPTRLQRDPWPPLSKRQRRHGKQGGRLVKLKAYLVSLPRVPQLADVRLRGWRGSRVLCGCLENVMLRWIRPIVPERPVVTHFRCKLHLHWKIINMQNLHPIPFEREQSSDVMDDDGSAIRLALINRKSAPWYNEHIKYLRREDSVEDVNANGRKISYTFPMKCCETP